MLVSLVTPFGVLIHRYREVEAIQKFTIAFILLNIKINPSILYYKQHDCIVIINYVYVCNIHSGYLYVELNTAIYRGLLMYFII